MITSVTLTAIEITVIVVSNNQVNRLTTTVAIFHRAQAVQALHHLAAGILARVRRVAQAVQVAQAAHPAVVMSALAVRVAHPAVDILAKRLNSQQIRVAIQVPQAKL